MQKRTTDGHTRATEEQGLWHRAKSSGQRIGDYVSEHPGNTAVYVAATVGAVVGIYLFVSWQRRRGLGETSAGRV